MARKASERTEWELIDAALALYLQEAANNRENAGYAGEWGDRGASHMEDRASAYKSGRAQEVPAWLQRHYEKVKAQRDPEFDEYQRLKKKFEGS